LESFAEDKFAILDAFVNILLHTVYSFPHCINKFSKLSPEKPLSPLAHLQGLLHEFMSSIQGTIYKGL